MRLSHQSFLQDRAVVVAQLVEWFLLGPEVRGSNPVIGKLYYQYTVNCIEKTKINKIEAGNGPIFLVSYNKEKRAITGPLLCNYR